MTDDEIDDALIKIREMRWWNNYWFIEWLRTSFKCPNCREAAGKYQKLIRETDQKITDANKDLGK